MVYVIAITIIDETLLIHLLQPCTRLHRECDWEVRWNVGNLWAFSCQSMMSQKLIKDAVQRRYVQYTEQTQQCHYIRELCLGP